VLDHADAGDRVEALPLQLAVVGDPDLDALGYAGLGHSLPGQDRLGLREGDPHHLGAVAGGGVDRKASPPASHVEHALARLQAELSADQLELLLLGLLQGPGAAGEDRAAVGHGAIEEQGEELVRDVVVVADRAGIAGSGAAPPPGPKLGGWGRGRSAKARGAKRRQRQPRLGPATEGRRSPRLQQLHHRVDVVYLERPGDVGASQPELAGGEHRLGQGLGEGSEDRAIAAGGGQARAVPELDREGALREGVLDPFEEGAGRGHA
jgi:hypothetical protein